MKEIKLTKGYVALVDDEDFEWISKYKWQCANVGYAVSATFRKHRGGSGLMHREILKAPKGIDVDHINHNKLDNRKQNLRLCFRGQNLLNKNKRSDSRLKYKGIMYVRPSKTMKDAVRKKPYYASIRINGIRLGLGYFATQEDAARAYNAAAAKHHGEFARLNEIR